MSAARPEAAASDAAAALQAQGVAWTALMERLVRNLERGGKQWTAARRKESFKRVLDGSRSDPQRLLQRLQSLMGAWESDSPQTALEIAADAAAAVPASDPSSAPTSSAAVGWHPMMNALQGTVLSALPGGEPRAVALADRLAAVAAAVSAHGAGAEQMAEIEAVCGEARRLLGHRHHLVEGLSTLCHELGAGLAELSEDDSWAAGQCRALQMHLASHDDEAGEPRLPTSLPSVRGVRAARNVLAETRAQQGRVREKRQAAREALKQLIHGMLLEVGELGEHTGRFQAATLRHAEAIQGADSLEGLAGVVHAMLEDARNVQSAVHRSQERLLADRDRAEELEARVRDLESELRRLSEEVSTDALTQVANRRGLMQAFTAEVARLERRPADAPPQATLAVALIDIDNFKRLNDTLGHAAGDLALKSLAAAVRERLRPVDHLARFGGEEFVVLLPDTVLDEGQKALTRLQRSLSEALFLHDGHEVFVTFSAGITAFRPGESLEAALERADEALYEAKRTGKNRTCLA